MISMKKALPSVPESRTVLYRLYLDGRVEKISDELHTLTGATIITKTDYSSRTQPQLYQAY